jgi:hypothetical protein
MKLSTHSDAYTMRLDQEARRKRETSATLEWFSKRSQISKSISLCIQDVIGR